jgi:small subunit ribosomal protein S8
MLNDTLANTLNNINMATKSGKQECIVKPSSKVIIKVLEMMRDAKYIGSVEVIDDKKSGMIKINLIGGLNKCGAIKPRFPVKTDNFEKFEKRYLPAKDFGFIIVSTPEGLMTHSEAKEKKIGGKIIAYVY